MYLNKKQLKYSVKIDFNYSNILIFFKRIIINLDIGKSKYVKIKVCYTMKY